ncbi:MAG TPA: stage V sporulation protein AE [Bacillota bacterium]
MVKRRIIVITDGDRIAQKVVERVARNVGGRAISLSGGNPTPIDGEKVAAAVKQAACDPVLVMVDDCGDCDQGKGEKVLKHLAEDPELEILGVVAVASNTGSVKGVPVTASINRDGGVVSGPVDKNGRPEPHGHQKVEGDTVDILNQIQVPVIIGLGDLGKMDDADLVEDGARITTRAVQEILQRSRIND